MYPACLVAAIVATELGFRRGIHPFVSAGTVMLALSLFVHVVEHAAPYREQWRGEHGDVRTDLMHFVFSNGLSQLAGTATIAGVAALGRTAGLELWPHAWPLALQVLLALLIAELAGYAVHRMQHERGLLWRLHAVHHSAPRLYWLSGARNHPLDVAITYAVATSPIVLMSASEHVLLLLGAISIASSTFQHANIDVRLGPLERIINIAAVHRAHHSSVLAEANANYGNVLLVWDWVFGTYRAPRAEVVHVGLVDGAAFPTTYLEQLASPFTSRFRTTPRP